jgi:hypothetical protein
MNMDKQKIYIPEIAISKVILPGDRKVAGCFRNFYKCGFTNNYSNLCIVSMSPGDRKVAGCFIFSGGVLWMIL